MRGVRLGRLISLLTLLLALPVPFLAQASTDRALTNADIVRMMKAGIPESIIVREIQMSETNFGTSAADLISLKNQGASERVLGAVLDTRSGPSGSASFPLTPSQGHGQSTSGPHHLPSFEADVRFDSKTRGKISVGQNHIKVEKSGVPLFSLKWKDKPAP
jgi:hypothetical protein